MKSKKLHSIFILCYFLLITSISAQTKLLTLDDAVMAARKGLVPAKAEQLQWIHKTSEFYYINKDSGVELLVTGTPESKSLVELFSLYKFNQLLKENQLDTVATFPTLTWTDKEHFYFKNSNRYIQCERNSGKMNVLLDIQEKEVENSDYNASTNALAYTISNNLWIQKGSVKKQITFDQDAAILNGQKVHREEFGITKGTFWSTKGNLLAFYRMDQTMVTDYPIYQLEEQPAKVKMVKYPMAGSKSHHVTIGIYDQAIDKTIFLKTGEPAEQYLTNIAWSNDEKQIFVAVLNRDQNHLKLNSYDAKTGELLTTLFEEKEEKYVQPLHPIVFNKDGSAFIWQSRRDGFNHLYLYSKNGKLIKQLSKGNWEVTEFLGFDLSEQKVNFIANSEKPINRDIYSVQISSGKINRLSKGEGVHKAMMDVSGSFFIDEFSGPGIPRQISVVNASGKNLKTLLSANDPLKEYLPVSREIYTIKNENGDDLYCRIIKPAMFDSTKSYPVIVYVYGGPGISLITNNWLAGSDLWMMYIAQRGYVIFTLENRGTPLRGKTFEQATFQKLGTIEMQDQLAGIKHIMKLSYIDKNRMGIYGWSYGGYMSINMMTRNPGIFRAAVAGGPVIDWSFYEVMYTERYMDTPETNPVGYSQSNLLNYVEDLKGKMMLIHGTSDDVVVWQHSLMYLKKAVQKNVQVDYFVYPGHEHNVTGRDRAHLLTKVSEYFFQNLK
ncbi:MAG: DPP IV N-terminal domain-containing protein [Bacteroidetes bacterium]|nr:DPP IV N-terminal domain-containing protein [Bacteroidota bacterium]